MQTRQFRRLAMTSGIAAMFLSVLGGCQAWSGGMFPFQNPTRVPPAGTGSYATPGGYYNNTSGVAPSSQVLQANATSGAAQAGFGQTGGAMPTTNFSDSAVRPANFVTPSFATPPTVNSSNSSGADFSDRNAGDYPDSASLNDFGSTDAPSLQWHQ